MTSRRICLFGNFMSFLYLKEKRKVIFSILYFFSYEWDFRKGGLCVVSNVGLLCIMTYFLTFMWINVIFETLDFDFIYHFRKTILINFCHLNIFLWISVLFFSFAVLSCFSVAFLHGAAHTTNKLFLFTILDITQYKHVYWLIF